MMVREPAVAGMFYPAAPNDCSQAVEACFAASHAGASVNGRIVGGVVPHAGWACSGMVAASVFSAIASQISPATVVLFGAVHRPLRSPGAIFPSGRWDTPLGQVHINERLAERVMGHTNLIADDPYAHEAEHSIEVQLPFIQRLWPDAAILPLMVPPSKTSAEIGEAVGRTLTTYNYDAVVIASSDLTHYGDRYGFTPEGDTHEGPDWAKNTNDRRVIDMMLSLDAEAIVPETQANRNACGGGAIAAAIAAARTLGADAGTLLQHTTSRETLGADLDNNAVGYAAVVFTRSNEV
jgi:AmmeMemoRadiSam system protein B